jgi:hypothetical protein
MAPTVGREREEEEDLWMIVIHLDLLEPYNGSSWGELAFRRERM